MNGLKHTLDLLVDRYQRLEFIKDDPIQIPRRFSKMQDIEITAFWTSVLAWGQRTTIINKATELFDLMDNSPFEFIMGYEEVDLKRFENFKHRTFQYPDTLYFIDFFRRHYSEFESLEDGFINGFKTDSLHVESSINIFHDHFFNSSNYLPRTRKHMSCPNRKSRCKRICMFLRWMVRIDSEVDLGVWNRIQPSQLLIPLDVHVQRSAIQLGLLSDHKLSWRSVLELSTQLRDLCPEDPIKYDFALFGLSKYEGEMM